MAAHLLYQDFFRFLDALAEEVADPWAAYQERYLGPNRAVLEAWWEQVLGRPRQVWVDRVRQVRPQDYGLLAMVVEEGDLATLAREAMARCQVVLPVSLEPEIYFLVGFFSPDAFAFRVGEAWAIGIGLERLHSQHLLPVLLAHEYVHCLRRRRGVGVKTLGARMVDEGVAVEFTARVFPERPTHEHLLMRPGQPEAMRDYESRLWEALRPLLESEDEGLAARVLYGQGEGGRWPSRAGSYLGWRLAAGFLERHPERFEAEAEEILVGADLTGP